MAGQIPAIISVNSVLMVLTFTALCARVGRRVFMMRAFSGHDILITVAALSAFIFSIMQIYGTSLGLGLHRQDQDPADAVNRYKLTIASNTFYFACNWAVKHALLLFYSEIVRDRKYEGSIWFMHFIAFGFGLSSILVNVFGCRPLHKAWHKGIPGSCVDVGLFLRFNSVIMLATDLVLYIMPVVFTWNLQLRTPQRLGLNILFGLGGLVLVVSSVRIYSVHKFASDADPEWWFAQTMIWSVLENHIAIIVACAPSVKVVTITLFPKVASSVEKMVSKVTSSSSRSRSRSGASGPSYDPSDLESGMRKSEQPKLTPLSTTFGTDTVTSTRGPSRASTNFACWFRSPTSPKRMISLDSMNSGLVDEHEYERQRDAPPMDSRMKEIGEGEERVRETSTPAETDIHVEHTITVENGSARGSIENASHSAEAVGRGV